MRRHLQRRGCAQWAAATALAMLLAGCAPSSADVMMGGSATASPVPPGPPGSADGLYAGAVDLIVGTACPQTMTISNFRVTGNEVRFGGFRGPVSPDGSVSLSYAGMLLNGRFQGDGFTGRIDTDNDLLIYARPLTDCLYTITVRRAAA